MAQDIFEALRQQLEEKRELQARLQALREERSALFTDVRRLDEARLKEQADVTKLEGRSLSGLLHRVTGRLEERLEREQAEARTAAEAHHAAQQKLAAVDGEMERIMTRLDDLRDVEYRYSKAEQEHKAALKAAGGALAAEIESLERSLSATKAQQETPQHVLL